MALFGKKKAAKESCPPKKGGGPAEPQPVLKQERSTQDTFQHVFFLQLLFRKMPMSPSVEALQAAAEAKFGPVDIITGQDGQGLCSFAVKKYLCHFKDASLPAQVNFYSLLECSAKKELSPLQRTQFWDVPDGAALYDSCPYILAISDFMSAGLPVRDRCNLLMDWLEATLTLLPDCAAVFTPSSGKLVTAESVRTSLAQGPDRFIAHCVNARFFNIDGTEDDHVVDTTGLFSIDLPDLQYHFHTLDPNFVVNHAYNLASYLLANPEAIHSGDTVDGIAPATGAMCRDIQWRCQYEDALIQPVRPVLDVCPGPFAAGQRG